MPLNSWPSQLKSVSRTRSGVGRKSATSGNSRMRLRQLPPMIRTVLRLFRRTDDHDRELPGIDAGGERGADPLERHGLETRGVGVEPVERKLVEADHGELLEELAVGVDAQRKSADQALFRRGQLGLGGSARNERCDHVFGALERFVRLIAARLQADLERTPL